MGIKMVSAFMISRRRLATLVVAPAVLFLIEAACNRVPLTAPSGSSITLTTATTVMPLNGTATITATSGSATTGNNPLKILVGTAAAQKVAVSATPATVPAAGGTSTISAVVFDINGSVLANVPVTFSTTAGTLSASVTNTNGSGT